MGSIISYPCWPCAMLIIACEMTQLAKHCNFPLLTLVPWVEKSRVPSDIQSPSPTSKGECKPSILIRPYATTIGTLILEGWFRSLLKYSYTWQDKLILKHSGIQSIITTNTLSWWYQFHHTYFTYSRNTIYNFPYLMKGVYICIEILVPQALQKGNKALLHPVSFSKIITRILAVRISTLSSCNISFYLTSHKECQNKKIHA